MVTLSQKVDQWFESVEGRSIDFDGAYGVQCADLSKQYAVTEWGAPLRAYGNGIDVAENLANLLPGWTFIPATGTPQKGDVASFGTNLVPKFGHVGVVLGMDGDLIVLADQGPTAGPVAKRTYYKWRACGYARPPKITADTPTSAPQAIETRPDTDPVLKTYKVDTEFLTIRTAPPTNGQLAPVFGNPIPSGVSWYGTGKTSGSWVEGRTPWMKTNGQLPKWVNGGYLREV